MTNVIMANVTYVKSIYDQFNYGKRIYGKCMKLSPSKAIIFSSIFLRSITLIIKCTVPLMIINLLQEGRATYVVVLLGFQFVGLILKCVYYRYQGNIFAGLLVQLCNLLPHSFYPTPTNLFGFSRISQLFRLTQKKCKKKKS